MGNLYRVEFVLGGTTTQTVELPDNLPILQSALEQDIDLPSSCNAGVCTTCAARVLDGQVDHGDAMGLGPELQEKGYVLLCVASPQSDLRIETHCEDAVYELQFGRQG